MSTAAPTTTTKPQQGGYDVPRPAGHCGVTGRKIEAGERLFAAIRETPQGIERIDVSPEAWDAFERANLLAYWQTVMPAHEQKKKVFVDDEVLCTLFERLADAGEPVKVNFRFVLGLILMRKRLIVYEDARRDEPGGPGGAGGRDVWIVRLKGRDERLDLIDPKLDEQQVAEVSQQLGEILNQEL